MILVLAGTVGALFAAGTYLILQRALIRVVLGFAIISHAINLLLLAAGGRAGRAPIVGPDESATARIPEYVDPVPQALALTAIVISFAITAFLAALAYRSWQLTRNDRVQDDREDARLGPADPQAPSAPGRPEPGREEPS